MKTRVLLLFFLFSAMTIQELSAQYYDTLQYDTIVVWRDQVLLIEDTLMVPDNDTLMFIPSNIEYELMDNQYARSKKFYDSLYAKAYKSDFTKELYNLFVRHRPPEEVFTNKKSVRSESFFNAYAGKTLTSIKIVRVDIIEGSVSDTTLIAESGLGKIANRLHTNTTNNVVSKHLLFHIGDAVDPYEFSDSERILRSLSFIEDARILLKVDPEELNNASATVIIKDRFPWSIKAGGSINTGYSVGLLNRNIHGSGNEFLTSYVHSLNEQPINGYDFTYTMRNIKKSFINASIYIADNYNIKEKGITIRRGFISPDIKYQGEMTIEQESQSDDLVFADSIYSENFSTKRNRYDVWLARAFSLGQRKNIGASLRFQHSKFLERPAVSIDSNEFFHTRHFLLSSIFFSKINFRKARNIFALNITEDVPVGFIQSIVFGKEWTEFGSRIYGGFRTSFSEYTDWGYFLVNVEMGSYLRGNTTINRLGQVNLEYFTPMIEFGDTYNRIFLRANFFKATNLSIPQSQSLRDGYGFRDIQGNQIRGNQLMSGTLESIFFPPWYFYGFRFAPFAYSDFGYVEESRIEVPYNEFYYSIGAGARMKNESLVFDTFELRAAYFPRAPLNAQKFSIEFSFSTPNLFRSPNIRKPKLAGLE